MSPKDEIRIISFPKILDERGNLSVVEQSKQVPFEIKRVYWVYDVPGGTVRGGHAFKTSQEIIIALSGSFDVVLHDGTNTHQYHLNRSYYGLYVPKMIWRHMENFSTNSLALIAASTSYQAADYLRGFAEYLNKVNL
jgi:hypothetical protein